MVNYLIVVPSHTESHRGAFWAHCYSTYMLTVCARVIRYADDAVLICTASTSVELQVILARDFN